MLPVFLLFKLTSNDEIGIGKQKVFDKKFLSSGKGTKKSKMSDRRSLTDKQEQEFEESVQ